MGDHGKVTCDESQFGKHNKAKSGRVRHYRKRWVFGLAEENSRDVVLKVVRHHGRSILVPIIYKHTKRGMFDVLTLHV